ncbi:MAG TPA: YceH family protein [Deltaproteobacteria bacterium]|nr:YceH family protein [Deltaproteobacteria bacterium]
MLTASEIRVLASLIEKEFSTPDYYLLSLNALTNACNQKTNRDPVVAYDEAAVLAALDGLKDKRLVWESTSGRVAKYEETFLKTKNLSRGEAAVLCELMLRGPQTLGEIKAHAERMYAFTGTDEVAAVLDSLCDMGYTLKLPRLAGHKEPRYVQLLAVEPEDLSPAPSLETAPRMPEPAERIESLEREVDALRQELSELKQSFLDFMKQFD